MAYPLPTAAISVSGEALPTYLTGSLAGSYSSGQTFTLNSIPTWLEVGINGQITANPLGTTGLFVVAVDFGLSTEEHILCSSLVTGTGVVTVWTDGVLDGRGWDGTTISAHSAGSSANNNCFPMLGGTYFAGLSSVVSTLSTTYAPKTGATSIATVGTVTAGVWNATPITNAYLANSAVTVGSTSISLGSTATAVSGLTLTSPTATNAIVSTTASGSIPMVVRGAVSQTADLTEWQSSASAILAKVDSGGNLSAPSYNATGLTGATTATRYVGGTANGAPVSGTFQVGDFVIDQTATIWVCTVAGSPGTWWSTISNHLVLRSSSATAKVNEVTIFTGSSTGQTISAPSNPQDGAMWSFINRSTNNVTLGFGSNSMIPLGSGTGVTNYTVNPNEAYSFINYGGGQWYMTTANGADHLVGVVAVANGGTGLSGFTASNNALYSTSASALTAGTLPIAAGGTSATSASGALTALGASPSAGSSSIATVGTVTAGTWNATAISNTYIANPQVTVGSTTISLGSTATAITGLTLSGTANTFSGIPASALAASAVTVGSTSIGLGGTATAVSGLTLTSPILNNPLLNSPLENVTIVGTGLTAGATGTATLGTSSVILYTASASGAFTLNVSTTASPLTTGQSATVAFMVLNGATAYAPTAITINGSAPATLRWQGTGATYPSTADASFYDAYTITVIQTAASTYTVFASQTKF